MMRRIGLSEGSDDEKDRIIRRIGLQEGSDYKILTIKL